MLERVCLFSWLLCQNEEKVRLRMKLNWILLAIKIWNLYYCYKRQKWNKVKQRDFCKMIFPSLFPSSRVIYGSYVDPRPPNDKWEAAGKLLALECLCAAEYQWGNSIQEGKKRHLFPYTRGFSSLGSSLGFLLTDCCNEPVGSKYTYNIQYSTLQYERTWYYIQVCFFAVVGLIGGGFFIQLGYIFMLILQKRV